MQKICEPTELQHRFSSLWPSVVLASQSPNRRKLLELGGTKVKALPQDTDETLACEDPSEAIRINAERKLESYMHSDAFEPGMTAISADTLVLIGGKLYGKPRDLADAGATLRTLSGHSQTVITGCGLYTPGRGAVTFYDRAEVVFRCLTDDEIEAYLETGEWEGAAGAYRLQKTGHTLIERIDGDWTTVVGLPLQRLIDMF